MGILKGACTLNVYIFLSLFFFIACSKETDPKVYFETGRYEEALPMWKLLAEQNDLEAQNFLGIHYMLGLGVKRDFGLAKKWFLKSAEKRLKRNVRL